MREKFETELVKLNNALVEMGALCEDAISCAVKYLLDRDEQMKESSVMAEKLIDNKEREIESIVKHGAMYHKAQITLESKENIGTTITVCFPK